MASIVLILPTDHTIVVYAENGEQVLPVPIKACACPCRKWFVATDPQQLYFSHECQQNANNRKRIPKTDRRVKR